MSFPHFYIFAACSGPIHLTVQVLQAHSGLWLRLAKMMGLRQAYSSPCPRTAQLSHSILQGPTKYTKDKRRIRLDLRPTTRSCQIEKVQFSISKRLFVILWTVACQTPLSLAFLLGNNTRVSHYFLLQGIFLTQKSNPHLLHRQQILCR